MLFVVGRLLRYWLGDAESWLRQAQAEYPADFWLNFELAAALEEKRPTEAIRYYSVALALRPQSAAAHNNLGLVLLVQGDLDAAIRHFKKALQIDPHQVFALVNLGAALHRQGDSKGAIKHYRLALQLKPRIAGAHNGLGNSLYAQGDKEAAIKHYELALQIQPNFADAHVNWGSALHDWKKDLPGAIAHYHQALSSRPNHAVAHFNLGNALYASKDRTGAIKHFTEALRTKPNYAEAHVNLGLALENQNDLEGAIEHYAQALQINPNLALAHANLGNALYHRKNFRRAIEHFQQALRIKPRDAWIHYSLANSLRDSGNLDGALQHYRQALQIDPNYAEAHCNLGLVLKDQGRFAEALKHLQSGHQLGSVQPNWNYISANWVQDCEGLLRLDQKLQAVLQGKAKAAGPDELLSFAGVSHSYKKHYAAAARFIAEALGARPQWTQDPRNQHRYNAACWAALAGTGQGNDAATLSAKEKAELRRQALTWLRADLTLCGFGVLIAPGKTGADKAPKNVLSPLLEKLARGRPPEVPWVVQHLSYWQRDLNLAGVREPKELGKLPAEEQQAWRQFWDDVAQLLKQART
jgi:tetratricopeptide (TPR) repeat protein